MGEHDDVQERITGFWDLVAPGYSLIWTLRDLDIAFRTGSSSSSPAAGR